MKFSRGSVAVASGVVLYSNVAAAANSTASIKSETSPIAKNLMSYYTTNLTTTGVLPSPYLWSEAATLFATMINYAYYTGDTTYSDTVAKGLVAQVGSKNDFQPSDESGELTSDQALWAMASMTAIETGFQNPSDSSKTGWLGFAQNVWEEQAARWNTSAATACKGGLDSGISGTGTSFDGLSNGGFFALSARLARYTGNSTFGNVAESVFSWAESTGLVNSNGTVFEAVTSSNDCKTDTIDTLEWSADAGLFVLGAAHMFNFTSGSSTWKPRLTTLLTATLKTFTPDGDGILIEEACERQQSCTTPQLSYKSILVSSLLDTLTVAPFTSTTITPVLQSSADAAVKSCSSNSTDAAGICGTQWTWGKFDGLTGAGQEMAALVAMQGLLVNGTEGGFKTGSSGGASASATGSGSGSSGGASPTGTSSSPSSTTSKKSGAEKMVAGYCSILLGVVAMVFVGLL